MVQGQNKGRRGLAGVGAAFAGVSVLAIMAGQAVAQDGGDEPAAGIDSIVVTAQKREQNVQEVGISITAFSGDAIDELGFDTSTEIVAQVPGLNFGTPVGEGNNPAFTLRGVGLNDFNDNSEGPIAVYTDEVYNAALPGLTFNLFDMQRVEVLRGPQGTLYGRNATGGLIHFISRAPTDVAEAYATLEAGSYGTLNFDGAVGGPIGESIQGRLSASYLSNDGYVENALGPTANQENSIAVRGQLNFDFGDSAGLLLKAEYASADSVAAAYQHEALIPAEAAFPFCAADVARDIYCYADTDGDNFAGSYDNETPLEIDKFGLTGTFDFTVGGIDFINIAHVSKTEKFHQEDTDMGPNAALLPAFSPEIDVFSNEFRASGGEGGLNWVAGVYYLDTTVDGALDLTINWRKDFAALLDAIPASEGGFEGGLDFASPDVGLADVDFIAGDDTLVPAIFFDVDYVQNTQSAAVFGQADYAITDKLTVTGGLRYTNESRDIEYVNTIAGDALLNNFFRDLLGMSAFFDFTTGSEGTGGAIPTGATDGLNVIDDDNISGKAVVDYQVSDALLVFASYSQGYKAGGFNAGFLDATDGLLAEDVAYDAEALTAYETGFKWTSPGNMFRVNASAFYYDYQDYQALTFSGLSQFIDNSDAEFFGGEIEVTAAPMQGLDISLGASVLDATVEGVVINGEVFADVKPVLAPEFTANGLVRYEFPLAAGMASTQLSFNHQGEHYFDITNIDIAKEEAYTLFDARVGFEKGNYELAAFVNNLTDEEYRVYTFNFADAAGFNQQFFGRPRWAGVSLTYRY